MRRRHMTYRVVSLDSEEASQAPGADGIAADTMLTELSLAAWLASGRPLPSYSRSQMPIRMTTLEDQGTRDGE